MQTAASWNRRLIAFLQRYAAADALPPLTDRPPIEWVIPGTSGVRAPLAAGLASVESSGAASKLAAPRQVTTGSDAYAVHGSDNQRWLQAACLLLSSDPRGVDFVLALYDREVAQGHRLSECRTPSHAAQHLTAHAAIRLAVRHNQALAAAIGGGRLGALSVASDAWWTAELWTLVRFWSASARKVVSVGARAQPPECWPNSSQENAIGAWAVGAAKVIKQPRTPGWADTWCLEVLGRLVAEGDDLGAAELDRVKPGGPKLWAPIHVSRSGPLRSFWAPLPGVLAPSYRAEVDAAGEDHYWYTPDPPEDLDAFEVVGV